MGWIQWFKGFDGVEQFLYGTAAVSTVWFGLALALKSKKEEWFREYGEALFVAVWLALVIRATVVEVYSIPSESMVPTLLVQDHLVVSKINFGWHVPFTKGRLLQFRKPRRGEIVIFVPPSDPQKSFVKRCVGIPGDLVQVKDKILYINGQPGDFATSYGFLQKPPAEVMPKLQAAFSELQAEHGKEWAALRRRVAATIGNAYAPDIVAASQIHEWKGPFLAGKSSYIVGANALQPPLVGAKLLDGKEAGVFQNHEKKAAQAYIFQGLGNCDWFGPLTLQPGQYWMMGDDRDNSADSRFFGPVPEENLRGVPLFRYWPLNRLGLVH